MIRARFVVQTDMGRVGFEAEIPEDKYDGIGILGLFQKYYPPDVPPAVPGSPVSGLLAKLRREQKRRRRKA